MATESPARFQSSSKYFRGVPLLLMCCSLVGVAPVAQADPLAITSGFISFEWEGPAQVSIAGPRFSAPGGDSNPEEMRLTGLDVSAANPFGAAYPVAGRIGANLSGSFFLSDRSLPPVYDVDYHFAFTGPAASASDRMLVSAPGCYDAPCLRISGTAPFRMNGRVKATTGIDSDVVFESALVGEGMATVGFWFAPEQDPHPFAIYRFEASAAAPEPATLLLVAAAAAWFARRRSSPRPQAG